MKKITTINAWHHEESNYMETEDYKVNIELRNNGKKYIHITLKEDHNLIMIREVDLSVLKKAIQQVNNKLGE